jgi:hypothetical protein
MHYEILRSHGGENDNGKPYGLLFILKINKKKAYIAYAEYNQCSHKIRPLNVPSFEGSTTTWFNVQLRPLTTQ